jgi:hypothetical protein
MSEGQKETFVDLCLKGKVLLEEIDDFVDRWHANPAGLGLREFLGLTDSEYELWVNDPEILPYVILSRRDDKPLTKVIKDNYYNDARIAARSDQNSKIKFLKRWLEDQGFLA